MTTETVQRGLTAEQLKMLLTPLNPNRVKEHKGNAHLEAWDIRRWLTRIFGFGGWDDDILSMDCIHSVTSPIGNDPNPLKHRCTAVYRVTMRLTIKDQWGNVLAHWDDGATGEGINQVSVGDAHDLALKAALSQALKRCAVNLCDQFGISLYNKGDMRGVVVRTLGHPVLTAPAEAPDDAPVLGGELDEPREASSVREPQAAQSRPRVERGPQDDSAWETAPDAPRPSVQGQHIAISQLFKDKHGVTTRDRKLAGVAHYLHHPVASTSELTYDDAAELIKTLAALPPYKPRPKESPVDLANASPAAVAEAERLTAVAEPPAVAEEERLRDLIESAGDPGAVEQAMSAVFDAETAGSIGGDAFGRLQSAGSERGQKLRELAVAAQARRAEQKAAA